MLCKCCKVFFIKGMKIVAYYIRLQIKANFLIRKVSSNCSYFCNLIILPKVFKMRRSSYPEGRLIQKVELSTSIYGMSMRKEMIW